MSGPVWIDKDLCLSSGRCVADEPSAFGFDADELAEVLPGAELLPRSRLLRVAQNCPAAAVILSDPGET